MSEEELIPKIKKAIEPLFSMHEDPFKLTKLILEAAIGIEVSVIREQNHQRLMNLGRK